MTGWVEYLINSQDPADKALLGEHRARLWAYAQTMQWVVARDAIEADAFEHLQQENDLANELQGRIHARGLALKDAGAKPASAEQVAAWNASWVPLVSNLPEERALKHWA
ncbi:hypothetical protein [Sphingopyxis sp. MSC1_008]|jgi:hypothetical protein|uniref:hypothetical protein n=1 Tax=Sphingopyxis sp. MSC1_008 TaxID=2909265 RepID=UPI0020C044EC|nr:hypothetical protein [Sphingopyxis sp. MSC1_008]